MIDTFKIRYLSYFLHEKRVSIILVSLFLLLTLSLYWLVYKFCGCRFQWCPAPLLSPSRSIHSALYSSVAPVSLRIFLASYHRSFIQKLLHLRRRSSTGTSAECENPNFAFSTNPRTFFRKEDDGRKFTLSK